MSACTGDRIGLLMECAEDGGVARTQRAVFLALASRLMGDAKPPRNFIGCLRALARDEFDAFRFIHLAIAARRLDASELRGRAEVLAGAPADLDNLIDEIDAALSGRVLETLAEKESKRVVVGRTFVRTAEKVGRNDPCPCGSGKKFKKCCEGTAERGSHTLSLREEFEQLGGRSEGIRRHLFDRMAPADLARLDPVQLSTMQLIDGMRRLFSRHRWEDGERYLDELGKRNDLPSEIEGYHEDLIHDAMSAGAVEVAERHLAHADLPAEQRDQFELGRAMQRRTVDALDYLERQARLGLDGDDTGRLVGLAFTVLPHYPALGIVLARAALDPARRWDSEFLLEAIDEARDQLDIDPYEPWWEYFEDIRGRADERSGLEHEREALQARLEELRAGLRESQLRVSNLETELTRRESDLQRVSTARPPVSSHPTKDGDGVESDEERRRLRRRIDELKGLIAEGANERAELRGLLTELARDRSAHESRPSTATAAPDDGGRDCELPVQSDEWPRRLLIPAYSKLAQSALASLPRRVASEALTTVAVLASGDTGAWKSAKKMRTARGIYSARCGRDYRVLFRIDEAVLRCEAVINRRDLDSTLATLV